MNSEKHNAIFKTFVIRLKGNLEKEQGQKSCNITSYAFISQCCMVASKRMAHYKKNFFLFVNSSKYIWSKEKETYSLG